ncbi:MAG: triose-phosphate isomerase [Desulfomonile tiedjei]|nr:triose-phosphate isomerase [Desulfomonile tiedjei]
MNGRRPIIAGNWKMHKTSRETVTLIRELIEGLGAGIPACEIIVAPPFTSIAAGVATAANSPILVAAQNLHWEASGAFTGEVSAAMVEDAGCTHVIVGHSERRQYFGDTDETVNLKVAAGMRAGLIPIFCLGETLEEREANRIFEVVKRQLVRGLQGIDLSEPDRMVVAYEPVWAIGTGRTATPEQAQEIHGFLRSELTGIGSAGFANRVRILYGGSVKPSNTRELLNCPDIDGALVGGASLKADDFLGIIEGAI